MLFSCFIHQLLRLDITPMTPSSHSLDPARLLTFPPSSLDQLLVVTSGARLLKFSASTGQLLNEVGENPIFSYLGNA